MKSICSVCGRTQGEDNPHDDGVINRVMCANCLEYFLLLWKGREQYPEVESRQHPSFMVTVGRRLVACNTKAESALAKPLKAMAGLMCGEFLDCEKSRLPEGCGLTPHCDSCGFRRVVAETAETGLPQERVTAVLQVNRTGMPEIKNLLLSARKTGDLIELEVAGIQGFPPG